MNLTKQLEKNDASSQTKHQAFLQIRNELLMNELKHLENNDIITIDEAIQLKFHQVSEYIALSFPSGDSIHDVVHQVDQFESVHLPRKRLLLGKKVADYVKTVLEVLDITWSIIEQFKYKNEKIKNITYDNHYASLMDTLLLKVKILHLTVLDSTYDDKEFLQAIETLKGLLEKRYIEAETHLKYTTKQIEEYNEIGPEFKTLSRAYETLLDKIQATKDDINRMKN